MRTALDDVTGVVGGGGSGIDVATASAVLADGRVVDDVLTIVAVVELVVVVLAIDGRSSPEPPDLHAVANDAHRMPATSAATSEPERVTAIYEVYRTSTDSDAATSPM